jgi:hypothetical protein
MNIDWKDLKPIRLPAAVLIASVIFSTLLIDYAEGKYSVVADQVRIARVGANEAKRRYHDSDIEKAMISQYLPEYKALQARGFIGSENRLKWIDALRTVDRGLGNFGVQYQLSAQGTYQGPLSDEPVAARLRQSSMEIRFGVVHEGHFLAFFDALEAQQAGTYSLQSCSLEPAHRNKPQPRTSNLNANCQIDWVTMQPPEEEAT